MWGGPIFAGAKSSTVRAQREAAAARFVLRAGLNEDDDEQDDDQQAQDAPPQGGPFVV